MQTRGTLVVIASPPMCVLFLGLGLARWFHSASSCTSQCLTLLGATKCRIVMNILLKVDTRRGAHRFWRLAVAFWKQAIVGAPSKFHKQNRAPSGSPWVRCRAPAGLVVVHRFFAVAVWHVTRDSGDPRFWRPAGGSRFTATCPVGWTVMAAQDEAHESTGLPVCVGRMNAGPCVFFFFSGLLADFWWTWSENDRPRQQAVTWADVKANMGNF